MLLNVEIKKQGGNPCFIQGNAFTFLHSIVLETYAGLIVCCPLWTCVSYATDLFWMLWICSLPYCVTLHLRFCWAWVLSAEWFRALCKQFCLLHSSANILNMVLYFFLILGNSFAWCQALRNEKYPCLTRIFSFGTTFCNLPPTYF